MNGGAGMCNKSNRKQGVLQKFEISNFFFYELKHTSPSGKSMSSILSLKLEHNTKNDNTEIILLFHLYL